MTNSPCHIISTTPIKQETELTPSISHPMRPRRVQLNLLLLPTRPLKAIPTLCIRTLLDQLNENLRDIRPHLSIEPWHTSQLEPFNSTFFRRNNQLHC